MTGAAGGRGATVPANLGRLGTAAIFGGGGGCSGVALIEAAGLCCVAAVRAGSFGVVARRVAVRLLVLRVVDLAAFFFGGRSLICPDGVVPPRPEITGNCSVLLA
jgi:hypothetical protein